MSEDLDVIPPDATILIVRSIPRTYGRDDGFLDFMPGDLFMWAEDYDPNDLHDEVWCKAAAISDEARDVFLCEAWSFDEGLSLYPADVDPVPDDLDCAIRAAVALTGEMPISTDRLIIELSNERQ